MNIHNHPHCLPLGYSGSEGLVSSRIQRAVFTYPAMIPRSRRCAVSSAALCFILLVCVFLLQGIPKVVRNQRHISTTTRTRTSVSRAASPRKLLAPSLPPSASSWNSSAIIGGWGCSPDEVEIYQSATSPQPDGMPAYEVHVVNACLDSSISQVHVRCGWFSSARLVNPTIFRRISYDDCLLNDGESIGPGQELSFQYVNSFPYQLSVASVQCQSSADASGFNPPPIDNPGDIGSPPPPS